MKDQLDRVWVSVYDRDLTDEQIKRLAFNHNSMDEGSRHTQWIERVKTCRSWAYKLADLEEEMETPVSTQKWRQSCQKMFVNSGKVSRLLLLAVRILRQTQVYLISSAFLIYWLVELNQY